MRAFDCDTLFGPWPAARPDTSLAALLSLMEQHDVRRALTASTTGIFHDHERGNRETLAACRQHPQLLPMATLNPQASPRPERAVERLAGQGFRVLRLYNRLQEWPLRYAPLRRILPAAAGAGLPVIVDCEQPGQPTALLEAMPPAGRFPALRVVMQGVRYFNFAEALAVMREDERLFLSLKNLIMPDSIEVAVEEAGAARLILATQAPADYLFPSLLRLEKARISGDAREAIRWQNAQRLTSA